MFYCCLPILFAKYLKYDFLFGEVDVIDEFPIVVVPIVDSWQFLATVGCPLNIMFVYFIREHGHYNPEYIVIANE